MYSAVKELYLSGRSTHACASWVLGMSVGPVMGVLRILGTGDARCSRRRAVLVSVTFSVRSRDNAARTNSHDYASHGTAQRDAAICAPAAVAVRADATVAAAGAAGQIALRIHGRAGRRR